MASLRHIAMALLAMIGLLSLMPASSAGACPLQGPAAHSMMRHSQPAAPANHEAQQFCAACLAVMPPMPLIQSHVLPPVALNEGQGRILSGIDPGLDPPPPRAG